MKHRITFDYAIPLETIERENATLEVETYTIDYLKGIANGRMFVIFEDQREYLMLNTGIIDYLLQFELVLKEIHAGNHKPFSVSCDYYSNSLDYIYAPTTGLMTIKDVNEAAFSFETSFKGFEQAFEKFLPRVVSELQVLYPGLKKNQHFQERFGGFS